MKKVVTCMVLLFVVQFAWLDLRGLLSIRWTSIGVAVIFCLYAWMQYRAYRIRRSLPKEFLDSYGNDPNFVTLSKSFFWWLMDYTLIVVLVVWRLVKLFRL